MKKLSLAALLLLIFSSCATKKVFYQVYNIKSPDVEQNENVLTYDNADCQITYNLWSDGGNLSFLIKNKTDKNLYLVMPKSFFIMNGVANDYYSESTYSYSVTNSAATSASYQVSVSGFLTNGWNWYPSRLSRQVGASTGVSFSEGVETKEMPYVCVPPNSAKFVRGFNISDHVYKDCDFPHQNYPLKTSKVVSFTEKDTPLSFRNRIAYTFDEQGTDIKYIEHSFWLQSLQNYSTSAAIDKQKTEECETKEKRIQKKFTMYAPFKFYNKYNKIPSVYKGKGNDGVY